MLTKCERYVCFMVLLIVRVLPGIFTNIQMIEKRTFYVFFSLAVFFSTFDFKTIDFKLII